MGKRRGDDLYHAAPAKGTVPVASKDFISQIMRRSHLSNRLSNSSLSYPPPLLLRSTKGFGLPPQVAGADQLIKYGVAMALSRGCEGGV